MNLPIHGLEEKAYYIRRNIILMLKEAGSGHPAGSLSIADVLTALYFQVLNHDPHKKNWEERDRLLMSNGHECPAWYATLAEAGYFPISELMTLRKLGFRLQGHPIYKTVPGIENTSGSLAQGISQACGVALAAKLKRKDFHVFCIVGDGEMDEGQVWEAFMFAVAKNLNNLIVIIDRNNIQSEGETESISPLDPLNKKLEAFGLTTIEVDGHNMQQIIDACEFAKQSIKKPVAIIAKTIAGKGVRSIENSWIWHSKKITQEDSIKFLQELEETYGGVTHGET